MLYENIVIGFFITIIMVTLADGMGFVKVMRVIVPIVIGIILFFPRAYFAILYLLIFLALYCFGISRFFGKEEIKTPKAKEASSKFFRIALVIVTLFILTGLAYLLLSGQISKVNEWRQTAGIDTGVAVFLLFFVPFLALGMIVLGIESLIMPLLTGGEPLIREERLKSHSIVYCRRSTHYCIVFENDSTVWRVSWRSYFKVKGTVGSIYRYGVVTNNYGYSYLASFPMIVEAAGRPQLLEKE